MLYPIELGVRRFCIVPQDRFRHVISRTLVSLSDRQLQFANRVAGSTEILQPHLGVLAR